MTRTLVERLLSKGIERQAFNRRGQKIPLAIYEDDKVVERITDPIFIEAANYILDLEKALADKSKVEPENEKELL